MFRKTMKRLTNNLGLKILAFLFSVALWLVVVNFDDPEKTKNFAIPVTVLNPEIIEEMGKVYDVVDQSDVAVFYVTGKRSLVDKLSGSNFTATADLSQVDFTVEGDKKLVPIDVTYNGGGSNLSITRMTNNIQITIEDLSEKQLKIAPETQGEPAEGYAIGEKSVTPNLITISGPKSIVNQVASVGAVVNVTGTSYDVSDNVIPILYDDDGQVIESDRLKMNLSTVTVNVSILGTKEVPVRCHVSGEPADGYRYTGVEFAPETVMIKGEPEVLNGITAVTIREEDMSIEGAKENVENTLDINMYLDEGVSLVNETDNKIAVKAIIEPLITKTIEIPVSSVKIENLDDNYKVEFGASAINVLVRGLSEELEELTPDQLQAVIDASEFTTETVNASVSITLDDKYEVVGTVNVKVQVIDKNAPQEGTDNSINGVGGNAGDPGQTGGSSGPGGTAENGSDGGQTPGSGSGTNGTAGDSNNGGATGGGSGGSNEGTASKPEAGENDSSQDAMAKPDNGETE